MRPAQPCSSRSSCAGGIDALSVLAPAGDGRYRQLRPRSRSMPKDGTPFAEDSRLCWHPSRQPLATAARRGQGHASSRRSATRTPTSRTSPRATSGRSARPERPARTGWMGRFLDRVGTRDNPLQGLSLDGSLSPSLATRKVPVAASPGARRLRPSGRPASGATSRRCMFDALQRARRAPARHSDPASHGRHGRRRQATQLRQQLRRSPATASRAPVTYPDDDDVPEAARRAGGDARGRPADALRRRITAPGDVRHPRNQAEALDRRARRSPATRCSPSSATSRPAGSPTAC